ncbi:MAG: hypothetical protein WD604_01820 [Balneolaceae bacterium]
MYLKNLLTITGRSPETTSDLFVTYPPFKNKNEDFASQGSRCSITAFLLLSLLILPLAGCDSPAPVGSELDSNDENIITQVFDLDDVTLIEGNSYTGRLQNSTVGFVDDPQYGTIRSVALLKPSISLNEVDSIGPDDNLRLKLVFNEEIYGDPAAVSTFELFEVGELWRGNELRYNDEVAVDFSSKIGEFQVSADEDTVEVDLPESWKETYLEFYNASSSERDSLYRNEFRGLAIVPSETNSKLHFLSHNPELDDSDNPIPGTAVSMIVSSPEDTEEDEDEELKIFTMRDWGFSFIREDAPEHPGHFVLHNGESVLRVNLSLSGEELESNNVVSAQLLFGVDSSAIENEGSFTRPEIEFLRSLVFTEEPPDLRAELFLNSANFSGSFDEDAEIFRVEITEYILNEIFGDREQGSIYITLPENGLLYTTQLYDQNGPENLKPRLVITSVKSDS